MATWKPLAENRDRQIGLNGAFETILYGTTDLEATGDVTTDLIEKVELDAPFSQGDPHPDPIMRARGAILRRKRLVAGPSNQRAVVLYDWGPPGGFSSGPFVRTSAEVRSQAVQAKWPKAKLYPKPPPPPPPVGPPPPPEAPLYWVEWVDGPQRSIATRVETKSVSPPAGGDEAIITTVEYNLGRWYVRGLKLYVLEDYTYTNIQGTLPVLRYYFRAKLPVAGRAVGDGFDLEIPYLDRLEEWYVDDLNEDTPGTLTTSIKKLTFEQLYNEGSPLP